MTAPQPRDLLLTCPLDCPDACRLKVTVQGQTVLKVTGDPAHPITRGFACAKTVHYPKRHHHPDRPLHPMRRRGDRFVRASWDEALGEIADNLRQILQESGPEAILRYHYAGTMGLREGSHLHAFFRALGTPELEETICATTGSAGWELGYGPRYGPDPADVAGARLILLWGINSLSTNSHLTPQLTAARKAGAHIVHLDPYENRTSRFADEHLRLRPGSDAALALALTRELFENGHTDDAYLDEATVGADELRAAAAEWTLDRAADVTGLSEDQIAGLAARLGRTRPTYIRLGYGMTRHENGGNALRAVSLLPALTGDWRHVGGGAVISLSGAFALNRRRLGGAHRVRPGTPRVNMNELADALAPERGFRAAFIYNCNPAVVAPDSDRVIAGLGRPDLLTVVLEQAMTETARLADWVLPATTFLEHGDVYTSYGHHFLGYNPPSLEPQGEARPNSWIFAQLARRLDLDVPELHWSLDALLDELLNTEHPHLQGVTPERLKREGSVRLNLPDPYLPYANGAPTPSGRVQLAPPPQYRPPQAALNAAYPLRLLTPPAHHFLNSTYGNLEVLNRAEGGEPLLLLHPGDAQAAGVTDGELARVESEVGHIVRRVRVSEVGQPGVAVLEGTWWGEKAPDGRSVNAVTAQTLTDLGGGSTFHNTRVRVVRLEG